MDKLNNFALFLLMLLYKGNVSKASKMANESQVFHVEGLYGLSKRATAFLRQHPQAARMAVASALEAAALQCEVQRNGALDEVPDSLRPFVVRRSADSSLIGVSEAAKRLQLSRTTVYDWVEKKILLGWKSTKRGLTIPAEQILGPGKVVPGIGQLLAIIDDPELVWAFLSENWPFADTTARPIDKLRVGEVEDVLNAAPSFGLTFT